MCENVFSDTELCPSPYVLRYRKQPDRVIIIKLFHCLRFSVLNLNTYDRNSVEHELNTKYGFDIYNNNNTKAVLRYSSNVKKVCEIFFLL